jgi:Fur family iron response transcriptional regulator
VKVINLPEPPEGMEIANVDIIVRLRAKRAV